MSFLVAGYVLANRAGNLTQPESHLLVILASHGNSDGRGIWPSYSTLSLEMKCHRTTVISTMTSLIKKTYVCKKSRSANNKSLSNQYYINVNKLRDEACKKNQQLDDEFDPFEPTTGPRGVVAQDYHSSSPGLPPQSPTATPVVADGYPNSTLNTLEQNKQTAARAPASLNTKEIDQAKTAVAAFVEGAEKKGHGEFTYTPSTEPLVVDLGRIDVSNDRAERLIAKHGEARIREAMEYAKVKAKTNPGGYFEKTLAGDWGRGWQEKKEAPKEEDESAIRRNQIADAERKDREAWEARENGAAACRANSERIKELVAKTKLDIKRGKAEALAGTLPARRLVS